MPQTQEEIFVILTQVMTHAPGESAELDSVICRLLDEVLKEFSRVLLKLLGSELAKGLCEDSNYLGAGLVITGNMDAIKRHDSWYEFVCTEFENRHGMPKVYSKGIQ